MILPSLAATQCQSSLAVGRLCESVLYLSWNFDWTDLLWCYSGNYSCYEFISAMSMSCPDDSVLLSQKLSLFCNSSAHSSLIFFFSFASRGLILLFYLCLSSHSHVFWECQCVIRLCMNSYLLHKQILWAQLWTAYIYVYRHQHLNRTLTMWSLNKTTTLHCNM